MSTTTKLTAETVLAIATDCLFDDRPLDDPGDQITVEGIIHTYLFSKERLEAHRGEVADMLGELPREFKRSQGGGWTFLNACLTAHGEQWGEHVDMERLFCLGIGLGLAEWMLPRAMWSSLPGGVPYVQVNL